MTSSYNLAVLNSHFNSVHSSNSPSDYFQDLTILQEIGKSKATVFLAYVTSLKQHVAVKVFRCDERRVNKYFANEIQFRHFRHPNIISIIDYSKKQRIDISENLSIDVSLIIMELAPFGDFYNLLITNQILIDTKLVRTYFHQLIDAIEYIHSHSVAHRDLKLENLLLGSNFELKVIDFDVSWIEKQPISQNIGTTSYRAPEVCSKLCKDPKAADIYSAGILLFMFLCGGMLPHLEDQLYNGIDLRNLLENDNDLFWEKHAEIQERDELYFNKNFKELFNGMVSRDVSKRYTIKEIKESNWYLGETYSKKELVSAMIELLK